MEGSRGIRMLILYAVGISKVTTVCLPVSEVPYSRSRRTSDPVVHIFLGKKKASRVALSMAVQCLRFLEFQCRGAISPLVLELGSHRWPKKKKKKPNKTRVSGPVLFRG